MLVQPLSFNARMMISKLSCTTVPANIVVLNESGYPLSSQRSGYTALFRLHRRGHISASKMLEKLNH